MPSSGRRVKEEEEDFTVLRLKGGGGRGVESDEDSSDQLPVCDGQVMVGGTPLQGITIQPKVVVDRIDSQGATSSLARNEESKKGKDPLLEIKEKVRERAMKSQRMARKAEISIRRQLPSDSEELSSGDQDRARTRSLERGCTSKKPSYRSYSEGEEEVEITKVTPSATTKRGPGRPPTTSEYAGLREEKERFNREKEQELKLLYEEKIARLTGKEIFQTSKINTEEVAAEAEQNPIPDITSRIREHQANVLRVAKSSANLKGTHQNLLNQSAGYTVGFIEALRTKMDATQGVADWEKIKSLKTEQENFRKTTEESIKGLEEALQKALRMAEVEKQKADHHLNLLIEATREKKELLRQLIEIKEAEKR